MSNMGLFDRQILAVLTDGKSRELRQILQEAGFSHTQTPKKGINTIFDHFRDKPARAVFLILALNTGSVFTSRMSFGRKFVIMLPKSSMWTTSPTSVPCFWMTRANVGHRSY